VATVRKTQRTKWYNGHNEELWSALLAFLLAYIVGSRGLDTGSWWEYTGTVVLTFIGLNRLLAAVRVRRSKSQ
jgi:hypothetical protein